MPRLAEFFGIVVTMNYSDHLPPHFHAAYGGDEVLVDIGAGAVYRGRLPGRALAMLLAWTALHRQALLDNWSRAQRREPLVRVPPLD